MRGNLIVIALKEQDMNELIGLKFKRNVYGLSLWTKTIKNVFVVWHLEHIQNIGGVHTMKPEIIVESEEPSSYPFYSLKEIVIVT